MKANAERTEKNTVKLDIEVDVEQVSQALDKAYRKLVKQVNIPGFRKGKTPRPILERFLGKEALYEEAMESLVPEVYYKAVEDTGIEPIDQPKMEIVQAEDGKPVLLTATVEVKPEVILGQYKGLEVSKASVEIQERDVDNELENLHQRHAKLLTIEEGTVEDGDQVDIDFLGKINGEPFQGGEGKHYKLGIGSDSFIPGFEQQLIGMSPGDNREIVVFFPADYQAEELAGQEATFEVTLHEIKRKELLALDDEFAKDVSEFDTLDELKDDLRNKLKQTAESRADMQFRHDLVDLAVENAEVEVPEIMINGQLEETLRGMDNRLKGQGINLEMYLDYTNSSMPELREQMRPEAEKNVRTNLVLEAIAKNEGIKATEEEIKEESVKVASNYQQDPEEFYKMLAKEGQFGFITESLVMGKTVELLVDYAQIVDFANFMVDDTQEQPEDTKEQTEE
ncbi:MAG: trigger factor [Desulfotomaculaceae bacterium]|nr:trigger factor [Desulfotomaculaceae bacterium]